jgi:hypothetical protein
MRDRYPNIQRCWGHVEKVRRNESGHTEGFRCESLPGVAVLPHATREVS